MRGKLASRVPLEAHKIACGRERSMTVSRMRVRFSCVWRRLAAFAHRGAAGVKSSAGPPGSRAATRSRCSNSFADAADYRGTPALVNRGIGSGVITTSRSRLNEVGADVSRRSASGYAPTAARSHVGRTRPHAGHPRCAMTRLTRSMRREGEAVTERHESAPRLAKREQERSGTCGKATSGRPTQSGKPSGARRRGGLTEGRNCWCYPMLNSFTERCLE